MTSSNIIAVIDDDDSVRFALESLLRSFGFDVIVFGSATSFLDCPDRRRAGCIISDVQMPQLSGPELQERLLAEGGAAPMIFITAFRERNVEARLMRQGALAVLHKPFDGAEIIGQVERAFAAAM